MNDKFLKDLETQVAKQGTLSRIPATKEYLSGYDAGAKWAHQYHSKKNKFHMFVMTALSSVSGVTLVWKFSSASTIVVICVMIIVAWAYSIITNSKLFKK